ncbi:holin [Delftia acidovorans]|uniref:holin n=1 Tax=Delftia acidovorans TaxID=80866 RepID=UPI001EE0F2C9|nr:holin [Delftia acidovorans]MCG3783937.1 phage holin family protein [Delftia acidovorans]
MGNDVTQAALEAAANATSAGAAAAMSSKVGWSGLGLGGFGWLLTSEAGVAIGIVVGVAGFSVSWYYRRKEFQLKLAEEARDQAEHELRMSLMRRSGTRNAPDEEGGQ